MAVSRPDFLLVALVLHHVEQEGFGALGREALGLAQTLCQRVHNVFGHVVGVATNVDVRFGLSDQIS